MPLGGAYYSSGQRHLSLMGGGSHGGSRWARVQVDEGKLGGGRQRVEDVGLGGSGWGGL